jgi:hypothetical protein
MGGAALAQALGRQVLPLLPLLFKRFVRQPLQFFIPPASTAEPGCGRQQGSLIIPATGMPIP